VLSLKQSGLGGEVLGFEFRGLQFQQDSPRNPALLARRGPGEFGESANHRFRLSERNVAFERVLRGDGLRRPIGYDQALVDTASQFVETDAVTTEAVFEHR
jgi:hypothetical protein